MSSPNSSSHSFNLKHLPVSVSDAGEIVEQRGAHEVAGRSTFFRPLIYTAVSECHMEITARLLLVSKIHRAI